MRINFQEESLYGEKTVKCTGCGKRLRRKQKFYQTLNPYNRLPDGTPKGRDDIYRELKQELKNWQTTPETCAKCAETVAEAPKEVCEVRE